MGIVNRRNAVAGWAAWKLAKRALRKKAAKARPPQLETVARRPKALAALLVAAAAGVVSFLRSRGRGDRA